MQTQTSTTNYQQQHPLTISILNRIFDFAAANAEDAILRLGLVSQQWKDTLLYSPAMWRRLMMDQWNPNSKDDIPPPLPAASSSSPTPYFLKTKRWTMQSFKMHYLAQTRGRAHAASDFMEIENCGGGGGISDDRSSSENFEFVCPVLAQNLRLLENEVSDSNGLNLMFCNICKKKVYPVTNDKEVDEAASLGRCVSMVPAGAAKARIESETFINDFYKEKTKESIKNEVISSDDDVPEDYIIPTEIVNVAVVISKKQEDAEEDAAQKALRLAYRSFAIRDTSSYASYSSEKIFDSSVSPQMQKSGVCRFLSKNALDIFFPPVPLEEATPRYSPKNLILRCRVVEVDPAPKTQEDIDKFPTANHPASSGLSQPESRTYHRSAARNVNDEMFQSLTTKLKSSNPLSNENAPPGGGWQFIFCADPDAARWFTNVGLFTKMTRTSYVFVLSQSQRLICVRETDESLLEMEKRMKKEYIEKRRETHVPKSVSSNDEYDEERDLTESSEEDDSDSYSDGVATNGELPWLTGYDSSDDDESSGDAAVGTSKEKKRRDMETINKNILERFIHNIGHDVYLKTRERPRPMRGKIRRRSPREARRKRM